MNATVYKKTKKIDIYVCNQNTPPITVFLYIIDTEKGFLWNIWYSRLGKECCMMTANYVGDGQSVAL